MRKQRQAVLGALDQQVMLAIVRQHPDAYGISIRDEIQHRTSLAPSIGAIYAALERLEEQGFIISKIGAPSAERGGKRKLHFTISANGQSILEQSLSAIDAMRKGLRLKGASA